MLESIDQIEQRLVLAAQVVCRRIM